MGERRERPTKRLDSNDLLALAKKSIVADETAAAVSPDENVLQAHEQDEHDDPLGDWDDVPVVATGSQSNALPTTSRTATLADPLTTQLLAEVARRTATAEFDPTSLNLDRPTQEIDPESLKAALRDAERTPTPTESAHANTKRRTK